MANKIFLIMGLWLFCIHGLIAQETDSFSLINYHKTEVYIPPYTPFFSHPQPFTKNFVGVSGPLQTWKIKQAGAYICHAKFDQKYTPIIRKILFFQVITPKGNFWVSPQLKVVLLGQKKIRLAFRKSSGDHWLPAALFLVLSISLGIIAIKKKSILFFLGFIVSLYWASLLLFIYTHGFFYIGWTDGDNYLKIAAKIANLEKPVGFIHPIGWPLLLLPLYSLMQSTNIFTVGPIIAILNSMVINVFLVISLFLLASQSGKKYIGILTAIVYISIPWFYITYRFGFPTTPLGPEPNYIAFSYLQLLHAESAFDLRFYRAAQWLGLTVITDTSALTLLITGILLANKKEAGMLRIFIAGICLGYSCCIRVSYVLFIPSVLLWRFILLDGKIKATIKQHISLLTGMFLGVLPQILENIWLSGSPFVTPYHLYYYQPRGIKSFHPSKMIFGLRFMIEMHYQFFLITALAFLYSNPGKIRLLISSLALTTLAFFSGFIYTNSEEIRFLYPCFTLSLICIVCLVQPILTKIIFEKDIKLALFFAIVCLHLVGIVPGNDYFATFFHFILGKSAVVKFALFISAVGSSYMCGGKKWAIKAGFFSALYLSGFWLGVCLVFLYATIIVLMKEIKQILPPRD